MSTAPFLPNRGGLQGGTATADAMGCQERIAAKIRGKGADYVPGSAGPPQLVKKLEFELFSGGMYVGKNPFCRPSVLLWGARGATAG